MTRNFLSIFLLILSVNFVASQGNLDSGFVKALTSFAIQLFQEVTATISDNAMISPLSVQSILSLAMYGAKGETKLTMFDTMTYSNFKNVSYETVEKNFKELVNNFTGSRALVMAFKIYATNLFQISPEFQQIAIDSFSSEIESMSFSYEDTTPEKVAAYINAWIANKTRNRILDAVSPYQFEKLNSTRLVLVNTIYFKDNWLIMFDSGATHRDKFYINAKKYIMTKFMVKSEDYLYAKFPELNASALILTYEKSPMEMIILLPNARTGLNTLKQNLQTIDWNSKSVKKRFKITPTDLKIPKWQFEFNIELKDYLKNMGMLLPFSELADFNGIFESLDNKTNSKISKVIHKTFINVNERGTEASAASVMTMEATSLTLNPQIFHVDHPFIFMLRYYNSICFIGQVTQF
ncbi:hypothetical protein PVAND_014656 [Polypedilum vanderplanki]|uniref:Serpin domain-containing protein n=1 Tax=Polypedilum vanderplanki TaxID=319348 RepID=A0A9J6BAN0_POLVA|nr:hypothetical protein PVAND_014656 [Polypedilum vanderplanki]